MEFFGTVQEELVGMFSMLVVYILLFLFSKWLKGTLSPYNLDKQLTHHDNPAMALSAAGYFMGMTAIFVGALSGPSLGLLMDLAYVTGYSVAGVLLLNLARVINDKLVLTKFSTLKEIIEDKNPGTGVVQGAAYLATGLVMAGAFHGEGGGPHTAIVFFIIGQVALIVFAFIYNKLTPYSIHDEIEKDNTAAGLGFAGGIISIGIIMMEAVSGDFEGWVENLTPLVYNIAAILVLLVMVRLFFDKFVLYKSDLNEEIVKDRNVGAGLLEMVTSISFAVVLVFLLMESASYAG